MMKKCEKKAVVLLSGGLDSSLALKLVVDQGIDVVALHFTSPFCLCSGAKGCGLAAKRISDHIGSKLRVIYLGQEYLDIVKNPRHGYGKNLNPCIDCRIFKFKRAKQIMDQIDASFVVTGEVLGQRPMSQHRQSLELIEKHSGLGDLIVRPLSAKMFEPTLPEREGWVDRNKFLDFNGRTRKPQMESASELGIKDYPCPAGGCLLTDSSFSRRMKDLFDHGTLDMNNVELLKVGRHFRLSPETKLVVGRDKKENDRIVRLFREGDIVFEPVSVPGPTAIARGSDGDSSKMLCLQIVARYTSEDGNVAIKTKTGNEESVIEAKGIRSSELERMRI